MDPCSYKEIRNIHFCVTQILPFHVSSQSTKSVMQNFQSACSLVFSLLCTSGTLKMKANMVSCMDNTVQDLI